jgi:diguanylate cyclase (GGDEF)-like protein/PAS domain S-box-containing protein
MSSKPAAPSLDDTGELSMLIGTLKQADQRLQEITAGEVDLVLDRDGQSFLLRHAQEELRDHEAAMQAAILNALPVHIALLDSNGVIVSVNAAWREFDQFNVYLPAGSGPGDNYLQICHSASGPDAAVADTVAEGIRAVLTGASERFSLEYHCLESEDRHWYLLHVTPLDGPLQNGAVVMHLDITPQKNAEDNLRRFAAAMDAHVDPIFLVDRSSMRYVYVNDAACDTYHKTRDELLAQGPVELFASSLPELEATYDALIAQGGYSPPVDRLQRFPDGSEHWVEVRRQAHRLGARWTIVVIIRDITERRRAADRIRQLNRLYAVLSGINTLIVRARSRNELFEQACRLAVEAGAFGMAWVGEADPQTLEGRIVARCGGSESYLNKVLFTGRDDLPESDRPASRALRHGRAVICNDISTEPSLAALRADLISQGHKAVGVFPLTLAGKVVAILALFSAEPGIFDEEEMRLLHEMAGDISFALEHIDKLERLNYLAYYDELTGLANRTLFMERAAQLLAGERHGDRGVAICVADLERFKHINYSLGRPAGDELLRQVSEWLKRFLGSADCIARVGADQFAIIWPRVVSKSRLTRQIDRAMEEFTVHPFNLNDAVYRMSIRIGVALAPADGDEADTLFKYAEAALKESKKRGERYLYYSQDMTASVMRKLTLENQLRHAIERREFVLHYQPKLDLASGALTGAEALIRWNDPRTGLVPPASFIPILEESRLIFEVGRWALRRAIEDHLYWRSSGLPAIPIAVNVSPLQLRHRDFISELTQAVAIHRQAAAGLELEITESVIMEDIDHSIASLRAIRALGVPVAIDDFGTGFSSLSYLSKLPVDALKIDRSFLADMTSGPGGLSLVSTIINLAHSLKLKVVAEGVESHEQARLLHLLGCDEVQGFLLGRPIPREDFETTYLLPATEYVS